MKELGSGRKCTRKSCPGNMVEVWTQYKNQGPINKEQECCVCGKVMKDPKYKEERERRWKAKKKRWQDKQSKRKKYANHKQ